MSNTSEYETESETSQSGSSEYHSGEEPDNDRTQIILVDRAQEFTFLNIRFPMPSPYPHPYIQLKELMTTVNTTPEQYDRITDKARDPHRALGYILYHFNIDRISCSIRAARPYHLDQVYYSTYVEPRYFLHLQHFYKTTREQLDNASEQERLELQAKYGRYVITNEIPITLLDCFLFL